MSMRWPLLLSLALLGPVTQAAESADRVVGPVPEEVKAFEEVRARFAARSREVEADTKRFVDLREKEERSKVSQGYDALISTLDDLENQQRTLSKERFEEFLERYPNSMFSDHVRFRLAELEYELAGEVWLAESAAYYKLLDKEDLSLEELELVGEEPKVDLTEPIALYRAIIENNRDLPKEERYQHLGGVYYMLGFCFMEATHKQYDADKARDVFAELVEVEPDSELADAAHLFLGNFMFDDNDMEGAVAQYTGVYEKGDKGQYYVDSMYQLAWSFYKNSDYDRALKLFTELLDSSEQMVLESGKESDYAPDAKKFMAHSFADRADRRANETGQDVAASDVAREYFSKSAPREYEWDVLRALADVLTRYGRTEEAVTTYRALQNDPRWATRAENPEFQMQVVNLLGSGFNPDVVGAGQARVELTQRYNEGSDWWVANRNNPEALEFARSVIEGSLLDVAVEYRVRAQESGDLNDFAVAASKYREYLDKFPISDDYYKQQWFLADSLLRAEDFSGAEAEYASLLKTSRYHAYGDGSLYQLMDARLRVVMKKIGPTDKLPSGAEIDEKRTTEAGKELEVYKLAPEQLAFIEAADNVVAHSFSKPEDGKGADYQSEVNLRRAKIMYIPAQILFTYGRYDEARPRLEQIIDEQSRTDEASYAAGLLVDSYLNEGDLAQVRKWTKKFSTMVLGTSDVADPEGKFASALESTAFKQCMALAEQGKKKDAAEAFLVFLKDFPNSEHKEFALYNAALYFEQAGKADRASELYERFVNRFPDHEWSKKLYFRIAVNYESTFHLDRAVHYYTQLVRKFPDFIDAPNALYNASFLKVGLRDYLGAAKGFEQYASQFDQEDEEKVYFMAGEQYEQVGASQAIRFYKRYLSTYGNADPDHAMTALYRIAILYQDQGNQRAYDKQLDQIERVFEQMLADGVDLSGAPEARAAAAEAAFRHVQKRYDEIVADKLTGNEEKDGILLNDSKPPEIAEFRKMTDAFVGHYNNFEYGTAALYLQGQVLLYYADLGLAVKPPKGLSEEEEWAYYDILEEQFYPQFYEVEDKAIEHLVKLVDSAKVQKRHSVWVDKAYEALNLRRPADYPAFKQEKLGAVDASAMVVVKPMVMPEPEKATPLESPPEGTP